MPRLRTSQAYQPAGAVRSLLATLDCLAPSGARLWQTPAELKDTLQSEAPPHTQRLSIRSKVVYATGDHTVNLVL